MNIFDPLATTRPAADLFYRRNDANDVRLGEVTAADEAAYAGAGVVVLGCPQDEGVRRNGGRVGAAKAPSEIRRWLYRLTVNRVQNVRLFDAGDVVIQPTLEETHALHTQIAHQILQDGKRLIVLGGGNDISYADVSALAQAAPRSANRPRAVAINVDAHFDLRADAVRNSGTPYRQILDEGILPPGQFYEVGYQPFANSPVYEKYAREKGVNLHDVNELRVRGVETSTHHILSGASTDAWMFWGFDMDVVRSADAPGVSAPNPTGLTSDELCQMAAIAGADKRTRLIEFTECNPDHDSDGRTARLAAIAIWYALAGMAKTAR